MLPTVLLSGTYIAIGFLDDGKGNNFFLVYGPNLVYSLNLTGFVNFRCKEKMFPRAYGLTIDWVRDCTPYWREIRQRKFGLGIPLSQRMVNLNAPPLKNYQIYPCGKALSQIRHRSPFVVKAYPKGYEDTVEFLLRHRAPLLLRELRISLHKRAYFVEEKDLYDYLKGSVKFMSFGGRWSFVGSSDSYGDDEIRRYQVRRVEREVLPVRARWRHALSKADKK